MGKFFGKKKVSATLNYIVFTNMDIITVVSA